MRAYELEDWEVEVDATIGYQVKDKNGYPISGRANRCLLYTSRCV